MNLVLLQGKIGVDPKSGNTEKGPWCSISLGTSEKIQDRWISTWHQVVAFGNLAGILSQSKKGDIVFVQGKIQTKKYEVGGIKKSSTQVIANKVFVSKKQEHTEFTNNFEGEELPF